MPWNGSGTFSRDNGTNSGTTTWADDAAASINITTGNHDTHDQDIATAITACLTKNGESKATADFVPHATDTYDLGTTVLKWEDMHLNGDALIGGTLGVTGATTLTGATTCAAALHLNDTILLLDQGADVASAGTLTLGNDGNYFDITGTTGITDIATKGLGTVVTLHFDDALVLTHSADLVLPGGVAITTTAGDEATFIEYASADWRCISYQVYEPIIKRKVVDIGDWNMDTSASVNVAHGLTAANIRSADVAIRNDAASLYQPLVTTDAGANVEGHYSWDATNMILERDPGGIFDGTDFNSTSYNRGWITIEYVG